MERITLENINDSVGQTVMYQIGILGFLIYKMTQGVEIQYTIVLVGCVLGIACTYRVGILLKNAIASEGSFIMSYFDRIVTEFGLMIVIVGIAMYILFYKGFYGVYHLFNEFSWLLLAFRLLVIYVGIKLFQSIDKLQTGFKIIRSNYKVE